MQAVPTAPTSRSPRRSGSPVRRGRAQAETAQGPVGLAPVVQPRHGLLADVAALLEVDGAVHDSRPPRACARSPCRGRTGAGRTRPGRSLRRRRSPARRRRRAARSRGSRPRPRPGDQVDAPVGGDGEHADPVPLVVVLRVLRSEARGPRRAPPSGADHGDDRPTSPSRRRPPPRGRSCRSRDACGRFGGRGLECPARSDLASWLRRSTRRSAVRWPLRSSSAA